MLSEPLPYHVKIRDYFKRQSGIWSFFSAARQREEQLAAFKTELQEIKGNLEEEVIEDPKPKKK